MDWTNEAEVKRTQVSLEQYKVCITDLGSIGSRYEAAHKLYFSLLGATVAVLTLTAKFRVIRELETELPAAPYTRQTEYLSSSEPASAEPRMRVRALITLERLIPIVFIFLLIGLAVFGGAR